MRTIEQIIVTLFLVIISFNLSASGVIDGQPVNAAVTNAAFLYKNGNDATTFNIGFLNTSDSTQGTTITQAQREFNALNSFIGSIPNQIKTYKPTWSTNNYGSSTDSIFTRVNNLDNYVAAKALASGHIFVGNASNVATDNAMSGDVTITNAGVTTVVTVGTSSSSNIHSAELAANAATDANTASTIVKRDGSGNFSAGTITSNLNATMLTMTPTTNSSSGVLANVATTGTSYINFSAATSISGFANGADGKTLLIVNSTGGTITVNNDNVGSSVGNRIYTGTGADLSLSDKASLQLTYDNTAAHWKTTGGTGGGLGITSLTTDVTATGPGAAVATIANNAVTNAKMANMPAITIKGNNTNSSGLPLDLPPANVNSIMPTDTEIIYKTDFETFDPVSFWAKGNNATFLTAGTFQGAMTNESTSPINNAISLKYVNATTGINDWMANPSNIAIPIKARSNFVSIRLWYKYDGNDNDIKVVVWDVTNSAYLLGNTTYPAQIKAASIATLFGASFYVPSTCANIRIGFQTANSNASKILLVDDIVVSTSPAPTNTYNSIDWTAYTPTFTNFGTVSNNVFYYSQQGGDLLVQGTLTTGTMVATLASMTLPTGLTIDSGRLSLANTTSNPGPMVGQYMVNAASSHGSVVTALGTSTSVVYFSKDAGQATPLVPATGTQISGNSLVMTIFFRVPISGWTPYSANIITPASAKTQVMTVTQAGNALTDRTAEVEFNLGTATITNFYGGVSTAYNSTTQLIQAVDDSGNTRTKFIALQPTNVSVSWIAAPLAKLDFVQIYKNGASLSSYGPQITYTDGSSITDTKQVYLNTGDYITVGTSSSFVNNATTGVLSIFAAPVYATMLVAVPPQQTCYIKDVKADGTAGGAANSGAWRTRDLNVINTNGSTTTDTTCAWASLSSNQFTLQPGIYRIKASAPAYMVDTHQSSLYNITSSSYVNYGTSEMTYSVSANVQTRSLVEAMVNIGNATIYEIRHYVESTKTVNGFGVQTSVGNTAPEVYTQVEITKVQ